MARISARKSSLKKLRLSNKLFLFAAVIGILANVVYSFNLFTPKNVYATVTTNESDTMTRQKISTASSHTIQFTLSGSETFAASENITVDFHEDDAGFTVDGASSVVGDFDFNDGTERTIVTVCGVPDNEVQMSVADATGIVTFTLCAGDTASGSGATITIEYGTAASTGGAGADRVTNPASAGSEPIDIAGSFGDDAFKVEVPIMDDDQVSITASVNTTITFDLDVNDGHGDTNAPYTMALGELSSAAITDETDTSISEIYVDLTTNADNGAVVQVRNANGASGLTSASTSDNIPTSDTNLTTGSTDGGYGIAGDERAAATQGTLTEVAPFNEPGTNPDGVGGLTTTFQTIFNTGSAPIVNGDGVIYVRAVAGTSTSAASDYTDTLTFRATATY